MTDSQDITLNTDNGNESDSNQQSNESVEDLISDIEKNELDFIIDE